MNEEGGSEILARKGLRVDEEIVDISGSQTTDNTTAENLSNHNNNTERNNSINANPRIASAMTTNSKTQNNFFHYLDFLRKAEGEEGGAAGVSDDDDAFISSSEEDEDKTNSDVDITSPSYIHDKDNRKHNFQKTCLYRKEYGGIVVYDTTARILG